MPVDEWLRLLDAEYLADFLRSGGSTVKVVTGAPGVLQRVLESTKAQCQAHGYVFAHLDAGAASPEGKRPDFHRIDNFFFAVTREVDWKRWAANQAHEYLEASGVRVAESRDLRDLDGIAADNGRAPADLINQFQREFATPLIRDHALTLEFRAALTALSRAQLVPEYMTPTTEEVLLSWFRGRTMPGASNALKRLQIFGRIDRASARHSLASFCNWLPRTGRAGLAAVLDFRAYEQRSVTRSQREHAALERLRAAISSGASPSELMEIDSEIEAPPPLAYSDLAYQQMLQLLRRFIDEVECFPRFALIVLASPGYFPSERPAEGVRSYYDYDALQTRIGQEVHDATVPDKAAALVHLEANP